MKKEDRDFLETQKRWEQTYHHNLKKGIEDIAEQAWILGIQIESIKINPSWIQNFLAYEGGVRMTLNPPKKDKYETAYGTIKVVKTSRVKGA